MRETCVRIGTGAPMPDGADAVVRLEDSVEHGARVSVGRPVAAGENVRRRGEDLERGEEVLLAGTTIGSGQIAAAAALGVERLPVPRRPVVTVIVTGDEVVEAGRRWARRRSSTPPAPGCEPPPRDWVVRRGSAGRWPTTPRSWRVA